jgi:hypothetical protein
MVRDQLHDPSTLNPRKKLPVPCALARILGGLHSRSRNNRSSALARHWSPVAQPLLVTRACSGPTRRMAFWNFSMRNRHALHSIAAKRKHSAYRHRTCVITSGCKYSPGTEKKIIHNYSTNWWNLPVTELQGTEISYSEDRFRFIKSLKFDSPGL